MNKENPTIPSEAASAVAGPLVTRSTNPEPAASKPCCLFCETNPAVPLADLGAYKMFAVFCSVRCAALQGMHSVAIAGVQWCPAHEIWSSDAGLCPYCEFDEIEPDTVITLPTLPKGGAA